MPHTRMHDDEIDTDTHLVRALLKSQFPEWTELPIERVPSAGTDNAMYRLGDDLAVRLPRIHWAFDVILKEREWLPFLAPRLPLAVPQIVAAGQPEEAFPHHWNVVQWLPGELLTIDGLEDPVAAARELAAFVRTLQSLDTSGAPRHFRGTPVRNFDESVRKAVAASHGEVDGDAVLAAWERVLRAPDYDGPPVWFHGDLARLNLLARGGRITAVIDWGTCGVGDRAIDMLIAWNLFAADARAAYRDALGVDDATWERGKGWALNGVCAIPYYRDTNPTLVSVAMQGLKAVLADEAG